MRTSTAAAVLVSALVLTAGPAAPLRAADPAVARAAAGAAQSNPAAGRNAGSDEESLLFGSEPAARRPAPRAPDGHPDLSGYWKGTRATHPVGNIGKDLPGFKLPLTPAGQAALKHNLTQTIDPEALCIIGGIPRHSASALPFQIVQNHDHVVFLYMYTYFRAVPVDGRPHASDPDPSFFGDKTGKWEGDTLVIDSVGFKDKQMWIDENGNPQSDAMHAIERWTRPDAGHLHLELTVDDPKFYTRPFHYSRTWVAGDAKQELKEYVCAENNIDRAHLGPGPGPIRADGTRGYDVPKLPDVPPSPEVYEKSAP